MHTPAPVQHCACHWVGFATEAPQAHCPRCAGELNPATQQHIDALRQEQHRLFKVNHPRTHTWSVAERRAEYARINALLDCWHRHQASALPSA